MRLQNLRKGISPLIASVLLIAFTLSVAMLAGPFFSNTLSGLQADTLEDTNRVQAAAGMRIELIQTGYNMTTGNLSVTIRNAGQESIKSNVSLGIVGSGPRREVFDVDLNVSEMAELKMPVERVYYLDTVQVALTDYPASSTKDTECLLNYRPAGYWSFDSRETRNGWAIDSSVNDNNGSLRNGVSTGISGKAGEAYSFNETKNQYILTDHEGDFGTGDFTITGWIYEYPNADNWNKFLSTDRGGNTGFYIGIWDNGGLQYPVGSHANPQNVWSHIAFTRESGTGYSYYNGERFASGDYTTDVNDSSSFRIGRNDRQSGAVHGKIDEVSIYDRYLTDSEVEALSKVHTKQNRYRCDFKKD